MKMNLPNKLSCFRMILVPIVVIVWLLPLSLFPVFNIGEVALSLRNIIALIIYSSICLLSLLKNSLGITASIFLLLKVILSSSIPNP